MTRKKKEERHRVLAYVVGSTSRPGELSLRLNPGDATWTPFIKALKEAGFKPGDAIVIEVA
jgi:hypothetical protein